MKFYKISLLQAEESEMEEKVKELQYEFDAADSLLARFKIII